MAIIILDLGMALILTHNIDQELFFFNTNLFSSIMLIQERDKSMDLMNFLPIYYSVLTIYNTEQFDVYLHVLFWDNQHKDW